MKNQLKSIQIVFIFLFGTILFAQEKLKITYEGSMTFDETNSTSKFAGRVLPSDFELIIADGKSEFNYIEKLIAQQEDDHPTHQITSNHYFIDLKEKTFFVEEDIFGKKYLVSDSLMKYNWKIEKETKEILGYSVRKATAIIEENVNGADVVATAWYASKLSYALGPELYGGLPGLILEMDVTGTTAENAIWTDKYVVQKVEVLNDDYKIKFPKVKSMSYEEAERIGDEYVDKINEMYSDGVDKD